jgi:hypothetical protein
MLYTSQILDSLDHALKCDCADPIETIVTRDDWKKGGSYFTIVFFDYNLSIVRLTCYVDSKYAKSRLESLLVSYNFECAPRRTVKA